MTEWQTKTVGELADTQLGKMLNKGKQSGKFAKPYLRTDNVHWGRFDLSEIKEMDIFPEEEEKYLATKGDLLMCEGGASGRTAIWKEEYNISFQNHVHRIRPKDYGEIAPKYLLYYFEWFIKNGFASDLIKGVTISSLSQSGLRSIQVTYPPIEEQHKIVEMLEDHLSRLDVALTDIRGAKFKSSQFRRSLLQAAFTGNLTCNEPDLKTEIPSEWRQERFGDIFKVKYGKAIDKSLRFEFAEFPVVGSAGIMTYTKTPLTSEPTIVIGRKGNVGSIQIFKEGCYPIDTTYYMPTIIDFDIDFLTYQLKSLELVKLDSSTATPSLRREDLENVQVVIPLMDEQLKIVALIENHLSLLDVAVNTAEAIEKQANGLRRALLQAAFTGKLTKGEASV
jgi:type I restriction enzyme S subunit